MRQLAASILVFLLFAKMPQIISTGIVNLGMITYVQILDSYVSLDAGKYPLILGDIEETRSLRSMQRQLKSLPEGTQESGSWPWGRIALALGEYESASQFLRPYRDTVNSNALLLYDALVALSLNEQFDEVIALYEHHKPLPLRFRLVQEAVASAYLNRFVQQSDPAALREVQELLPWDLYLTYYQWQRSQEVNDDLAAIDLREKLENFDITAIHPADERLLRFVGPIIPNLLADGIWDRPKTSRVVSFLVWQHYMSDSVGQMLQDLIAIYPDEPDWLSYLTEQNDRWQATEAEQARHSIRSDNKEEIVSQLLKVSPKQVRLGQNLLPNGDFEIALSGWPSGWKVADYVTGSDRSRPQAAFFAAVDPLVTYEGELSFRIDGIWHGNGSGFFGAVALPVPLAGTYFLPINPGRPYLISGNYRTQGSTERASIYVGNPQSLLAEVWLTATDQQWRSFEYVGCRSGNDTGGMQLVMQTWNEGSVWFDNISVQEVSVSTEADACAN